MGQGIPLHRRLDLPVCLLALWVAVMGSLYIRAMVAERGPALRAPLTAITAWLGMADR